jgi:hypothetical protein
MKEVKIHPYVEDGVLKVSVDAIDRENGSYETLNPDGTWRKATLYMRDTIGGFVLSKTWTERIANDLAVARLA